MRIIIIKRPMTFPHASGLAMVYIDVELPIVQQTLSQRRNVGPVENRARSQGMLGLGPELDLPI